MGTSDLEAQIVNLKLEYAAESERVQVLERHLDVLLRKNEFLETSLAKTKALLAVSMSDASKSAEAPGPDVSAVIPKHQMAGASALAEALLKLLGSEQQIQRLTTATASTAVVNEVEAEPAPALSAPATPPAVPEATALLPEASTARALALRPMHLKRHASDDSAPGGLEILADDAYSVRDIWKFVPLDETSHRSFLDFEA